MFKEILAHDIFYLVTISNHSNLQIERSNITFFGKIQAVVNILTSLLLIYMYEVMESPRFPLGLYIRTCNRTGHQLHLFKKKLIRIRNNCVW